MQNVPAPLPRIIGYAVLTAAAGVAAGLGFALWSEHSAGIFLALVDAGLSWCF